MEPIVIGLLVAAGISLVVYVRRRRARLVSAAAGRAVAASSVGDQQTG